jgi:hypothetical protein
MSVPELAVVLGWDRANAEGQVDEPVDGTVDGDRTESPGEANESIETNGAAQNKKKHPIFCLEKLLQVSI